MPSDALSLAALIAGLAAAGWAVTDLPERLGRWRERRART